ncbi:MAG: hypothetical protein FWD88_00570 [Treponema sp.]|nr:hypothetical protein [Treponema sp.]
MIEDPGETPRTGTDMLWHGMIFFIDDRNILADLMWLQRFPKLTIQRNPTQNDSVISPQEAARPLFSLGLRINGNPYFLGDTEVLFNRELVIEGGSTLDVFVGFTDQYQHLERRHLENQIPLVRIQEAGEYSGNNWNPELPSTPAGFS